MPIYDYSCGACGRVTEVIHGINDSGPRFCPSCGAEGRMRKALTAPAVVFKGSGWAKLDRRSASGRTSSARSSTKAASSASGSPGGASQSSPGAATGGGSSDAAGGSSGAGDGGGD